jgi:hypothetical protein
MLRGVMSFQRLPAGPSATLLPAEGGCIPLLLSSAQLYHAPSFDGHPVVAKGRALAQPETAADVIAVRVAGRNLLTGACASSPIVLYVDTLSHPAGVSLTPSARPRPRRPNSAADWRRP